MYCYPLSHSSLSPLKTPPTLVSILFSSSIAPICIPCSVPSLISVSHLPHLPALSPWWSYLIYTNISNISKANLKKYILQWLLDISNDKYGLFSHKIPKASSMIMRHTSSLYQGNNNECDKEGWDSIMMWRWLRKDWVALDKLWVNTWSMVLKLRTKQLRRNELLRCGESSRDSTWRSNADTQKKYSSQV